MNLSPEIPHFFPCFHGQPPGLREEFYGHHGQTLHLEGRERGRGGHGLVLQEVTAMVQRRRGMGEKWGGYSGYPLVMSK